MAFGLRAEPDTYEGLLYVLVLDVAACLSVLFLFSLFRHKIVKKIGSRQPLLNKSANAAEQVDGKAEVSEGEDINVSSNSKGSHGITILTSRYVW